eukprot:2618918-Amphidinium_carterae.1
MRHDYMNPSVRAYIAEVQLGGCTSNSTMNRHGGGCVQQCWQPIRHYCRTQQAGTYIDILLSLRKHTIGHKMITADDIFLSRIN